MAPAFQFSVVAFMVFPGGDAFPFCWQGRHLREPRCVVRAVSDQLGIGRLVLVGFSSARLALCRAMANLRSSAVISYRFASSTKHIIFKVDHAGFGVFAQIFGRPH